MLRPIVLFMGICMFYGKADNTNMASSDSSARTVADSPTIKKAGSTTPGSMDCPCGTITLVRNEQGKMVDAKREVCENPATSKYQEYCFYKILFAPCKRMSPDDCSKSTKGIYIKKDYGNYQKNLAANSHLGSLSVNNYVKLDNGQLTVAVKCAGLKGCRQLFRDGLMAFTNGQFYQEDSSPLPATSNEMKKIHAYLKQMAEINKLNLDSRRPPRSMESDHRYSPEVADMFKPETSTPPASTSASSMSQKSTTTNSPDSYSTDEMTSSSQFSGSGKYDQEVHETVFSTTETSDSDITEPILFWFLVILGAGLAIASIVAGVLLVFEIPKYLTLKREEEQLLEEKRRFEAYKKEQSVREAELNAASEKLVLHIEKQKAKLAEYEITRAQLESKLAAEKANEAELKASIAEITERIAEFNREISNINKHAKEEEKYVLQLNLRNKLDLDDCERHIAKYRKLMEMKTKMVMEMAAKIEAQEKKVKAVE